ncbi:MAG: thioredoxin family protein [Myxococcota bacterium]
MNVRGLLCLFAIPSLVACEMSELETPVTGTCDAATAQNLWPQFVGTNGTQPAPTDIGWNEGQTPPDFQLVDQFGDPMCLWQLVGKWVVMDSSTLWCEPCKRIAKTVECQAETYGEDVVYTTFIVQDAQSQPAEQIHAEQWSTEFNLAGGTQTPVVSDGGQIVTSNFPGNGAFPVLMLLNPALEIELSGVGESADVPVRAALDEQLGVDSDPCHE